METLEIKKQDALKAYENAKNSGKKLLEDLFGKKTFNQNIKERIKTFEDACEALNINPEEIKIKYPDSIAQHATALLAHAKLVIIVDALNDGWTPDWSNSNEYKYYPWFNMGSPSGSGFSYYVYVYWRAYSGVGSRLCFKSSELAEYAGQQFEQLYKEYFTL